VPACAGGDGDDAVGALVDRLVCELVRDHVVQDDATVGVNGLVDLLTGTERGDHDRDPVLDDHLEVLLEPLVGAVHDLVDGERRDVLLGVACRVVGVALGDLLQPVDEHRLRTRVECRERPDDSGLALGGHQFRP
jgi:hypothetical protein